MSKSETLHRHNIIHKHKCIQFVIKENGPGFIIHKLSLVGFIYGERDDSVALRFFGSCTNIYIYKSCKMAFSCSSIHWFIMCACAFSQTTTYRAK